MFAKLGEVQPKFNKSISFWWENLVIFCIASTVGTISLFLYHMSKSLKDFIPSLKQILHKYA